MAKIVGPLNGLSRSGPIDHSQNSPNIPRSGFLAANPYAGKDSLALVQDMVFGSNPILGAASGTADTTGTATGTVSATGVNGTATGNADTTGAATGTVLLRGAASGNADTTGSATGAVAIRGQASGAADTTGTATGTVTSSAITGQASGLADTTGSATGTVSGGPVIIRIDGTDGGPRRSWYDDIRDRQLAELEEEIAALQSVTPARRKKKARQITQEFAPVIADLSGVRAALKALVDESGWHRTQIDRAEAEITQARQEHARRKKRRNEDALLLLM